MYLDLQLQSCTKVLNTSLTLTQNIDILNYFIFITYMYHTCMHAQFMLFFDKYGYTLSHFLI